MSPWSILLQWLGRWMWRKDAKRNLRWQFAILMRLLGFICSLCITFVHISKFKAVWRNYVAL